MAILIFQERGCVEDQPQRTATQRQVLPVLKDHRDRQEPLVLQDHRGHKDRREPVPFQEPPIIS
jgi:hypothetical protein